MDNSKARLCSIDVMRGFLMFWLIGGEKIVSALSQLSDNYLIQWMEMQLQHVPWNGVHFYDMLFPSFLFVSGMTYPFSLKNKKRKEEPAYMIYFSVLKRGLLLVLLGFVYNGLLEFNFSEMRYASVLGRIGVAWMVAALIFTAVKDKRKCIFICIVVLVSYWLVLRYVPAPDYSNAGLFTREGCFAGYIDRKFLPGVVLEGTLDPEGIMSTFPAVVTALLGMLLGEFLLLDVCSGNRKKEIKILVLVAVFLVCIGLLWSIIFPMNKHLWSSSFVCYLAGIDTLVFVVLYIIVDLLKVEKWTFPFKVIGSNSIFAYMLNRTGCIGTLTMFFGGGLIGCFEEKYNDLLYWCGYFIIIWLLLFFLYKKKVFIKV